MRKAMLVVISIIMFAAIFFGSAWASGEGTDNTFYGLGAGAADTLVSQHYNTFIGSVAGHANNVGDSNTFVGEGSGYSNTIGNTNTFIGRSSGINNTSGSRNNFMGMQAGDANTVGSGNNCLGYQSGASNVSGLTNIYIGDFAGVLSTGSSNTFVGGEAGDSNTTGSLNLFLGFRAGNANTTSSNRLYIDNCYLYSGSSNDPVCDQPLIYGEFDTRLVRIRGTLETTVGVKFPDGNTQTTAAVTGSAITSLGSSAGSLGNNNSFIGVWAGHTNIDGHDNTFVGGQSGNSNDHGSENSFFGYDSGAFNKGGNRNTFIGIYSGYGNISGSANTSLGYESGNTNSTGNNNTSIGAQAGNNSVGSGNIFLGYQAGYTETGSNKLYIDNCYAGGSGVCNQPLIYGEFDNRLVQINGKLVFTSDERLKKNIEPLKASLDKVMDLKGVSYEWKSENGFGKGKEIGLIAQDVEAVIPELVYTDSKGYKALSYDKMVPVLVEAIKEQQTVIQELKREMAKLTAEVNKLKSKDMTVKK